LSEQAVYTSGVGTDAVIFGVYVDDLIVTGENPEEISLFKKQMITTEFEMTYLVAPCLHVLFSFHASSMPPCHFESFLINYI